MTIREFINVIMESHISIDSEIFITDDRNENAWSVDANSIKINKDEIELLLNKMEDGYY